MRNATKTLDVKRHPEVTFRSSDGNGRRPGRRRWRVDDPRRDPTTDRDAGPGRRPGHSLHPGARQTDFEVKPYSLMFGQLKVADEVVVDLDVQIPG